jgi:hypothetical protein
MLFSLMLLWRQLETLPQYLVNAPRLCKASLRPRNLGNITVGVHSRRYAGGGSDEYAGYKFGILRLSYPWKECDIAAEGGGGFSIRLPLSSR